MPRLNRQSGYTLIELLAAVGIATALAAMSLPALASAIDGYRTLAAARYVATRLQSTRLTAVTRDATTAVRFTATSGSYRYASYIDGNGDGVRTADIDAGIDRNVQPDEQLSSQFKGVDFGALPGLPAVDSSGTPPGSDPIRLGASNAVSFTSIGTATPGSVYIRGPRSTQFVVRVFGETGKTRILKFDTKAWRWLYP